MTYRVYFNRANEAPQVWSVDEGTQASEINVSAVLIVSCSVRTAVDLNETVNRDRPKAWLEVQGFLTVNGGVATITPWPPHVARP